MKIKPLADRILVKNDAAETKTASGLFIPEAAQENTVDSDCSHEIERHLLLGRKAMTNLDSVLKSRDISLLTKVRIVKAMIFLVVTYESWTIKEAEH